MGGSLQCMLVILLLGWVNSAPRLAPEYDWSARLTARPNDDTLSRKREIQSLNPVQLHDDGNLAKRNGTPVLLDEQEPKVVENHHDSNTEQKKGTEKSAGLLLHALLKSPPEADLQFSEGAETTETRNELEVRVATLLESVQDSHHVNISFTDNNTSAISADLVVGILNDIIEMQHRMDDNPKTDNAKVIELVTLRPAHIDSIVPVSEVIDEFRAENVASDIFKEIPNQTPVEVFETLMKDDDTRSNTVGTEPEDETSTQEIADRKTTEDVNTETAVNNHNFTLNKPDEPPEKAENIILSDTITNIVLDTKDQGQVLDAESPAGDESQDVETDVLHPSETTSNSKTDMTSFPKIVRIVEVKNKTLDDPEILNRATTFRAGKKIRLRRPRVSRRGKAFREFSAPGIGNREINYSVLDNNSKQVYGHQATYLQTAQHGTYFVHFSDGTVLLVTYTADINGYRPILRYFKSLDEMNAFFASQAGSGVNMMPGFHKPHMSSFNNQHHRPNAIRPPNKASPSKRPSLQPFVTLSTTERDVTTDDSSTTVSSEETGTTESTMPSGEADTDSGIQISTPLTLATSELPSEDLETMGTSAELLTFLPTTSEIGDGDLATTVETSDVEENTLLETTESATAISEDTTLTEDVKNTEELVDSVTTESIFLSTDGINGDLTTQFPSSEDKQTQADISFDDILLHDQTTQLDFIGDCSGFQDLESCGQRNESVTITEDIETTTVPFVTEEESSGEESNINDQQTDDISVDDSTYPTPVDGITEFPLDSTEITTFDDESLTFETQSPTTFSPFLEEENEYSGVDAASESSTDVVQLNTDYFADYDEISNATDNIQKESREEFGDSDDGDIEDSREKVQDTASEASTVTSKISQDLTTTLSLFDDLDDNKADTDENPSKDTDTDEMISSVPNIPGDFDEYTATDTSGSLMTTEILSVTDSTTEFPLTALNSVFLQDDEKQKENEIVQILPPPTPSQQALLQALMPKHLQVHDTESSPNAIESTDINLKNDSSFSQSVNVTPIIPYGNISPEYITIAVFPSRQEKQFEPSNVQGILVFHLPNTSLIQNPDSGTTIKPTEKENTSGDPQTAMNDPLNLMSESPAITPVIHEEPGGSFIPRQQSISRQRKLPFLSAKRLRPKPVSRPGHTFTSVIPAAPEVSYQTDGTEGRAIARPKFIRDNFAPTKIPSTRNSRLYRYWLNRRGGLSLPQGKLRPSPLIRPAER